MIKPKAINREKLVAFVLPIIKNRKGGCPDAQRRIGEIETEATQVGEEADRSQAQGKTART